MVELKREVNRDSTLTLTCDNSSTLSHFSRDLHHDLMFLLIQCQTPNDSLSRDGCVWKWDGDKGTGHWDARVGTWDLGTRDEGLAWGGDAGTCGTGTRGIIAKFGGKCDISFFAKMCYLWSTLVSIRNTLWCLHKTFRYIGVGAVTIVIRVRHC